MEPEPDESQEPEADPIYDHVLKWDDGNEMTVGEAKDKLKEYRGREADMDKTQTELLRDMAQVNQILANGGPMNQQQVNELNAYRENYLVQQHEVMMRAHPEWKDHAVMTQAKADMIEVAMRYGKSAEMVGQIQSAMDLQMLYDLTKLTKERERAQQSIKERAKPKPRNPGRKPQTRRSPVNNLDRALDEYAGKGADNTNWSEIDQLLG